MKLLDRGLPLWGNLETSGRPMDVLAVSHYPLFTGAIPCPTLSRYLSLCLIFQPVFLASSDVDALSMNDRTIIQSWSIESNNVDKRP